MTDQKTCLPIRHARHGRHGLKSQLISTRSPFSSAANSVNLGKIKVEKISDNCMQKLKKNSNHK